MSLRKIIYSALLFSCLWTIHAADEPTYRICMCWIPQAQFAGFYVAQRDGLYKKAGVNIVIEHSQAGENLLKRLKERKIDFAVEWLLNGLKYRVDGYDIVNVAQFHQISPEMLIAKKTSEIKTLADVKNRRIGIWPNKSFRISFECFLKHHNVSGYELIPILTKVDMFLFGGVDAIAVMSFNEYKQVLLAGYLPDELVVFPLSKTFPRLVTDGLYCRGETWRAAPAEVKKICEATMEGWRRAFIDKERTLQLIREKCKESNRNNPTQFSAFNLALQRHMLHEMETLIFFQKNAGELHKESFLQGLSILKLPSDAIRFKDFAPMGKE